MRLEECVPKHGEDAYRNDSNNHCIDEAHCLRCYKLTHEALIAGDTKHVEQERKQKYGVNNLRDDQNRNKWCSGDENE